ncbi:MAG TPA: response regulator [Chitinophagales bacterium]|nr:response regulator [Chitinophagales bacterium]
MKLLQTKTPFKKVMVIDDNHIDRYLAEIIIKRASFAEETVMQDSARSALEYLASHAMSPADLPQLIFLDIRMPELDGFAFLELYEKLPEAVQQRCIIMMLTSSLDPEDHDRALNSKFVSQFLNKPLNRVKLESLLANQPCLDTPVDKVA